MSLPLSLRLTLALLLIFLRHVSASEDEIRSLLEFKKGIKSDPSNRISSTWVFPFDASACPDAFHGIVCDSSTSSVVAISLDRLGLVGELKFTTLIALKFLQNLTLAGNSLSGRLVPSLGLISSLQAIDLSGNQFYGPISGKLTDLWALHYVNLSNNKFDGGFPEGIGKLQQLKVLDLHSNQLEGDVGKVISELRNVEYLDLSGNRFSGSMELSAENVASLANTVQYVNMSGNALGGKLWASDVMRLFRDLKVLDLGNNGIVGKILDFGQLPNLQVLRLGSNQFSGSLPGEFLQGGIPLVELDLSCNQFSGLLPEINSTTLGALNLSSNLISGQLLSSVGNCRIIDLSRNFLSDDISVLENWNPDLEILDLSSNSLTGNVPNFTRFQRLYSLNIGNNSLKGNLPLALGSKLNMVDLSSNRLDGPIPHSFFASTTLTRLNLSGNVLTGQIPLEGAHASELLVLSSGQPLESLDLSNNFLTGGLPSDIGSLARLKLLNLAYNNLSGQLPNELSRLVGLEYLNLSHNYFTGSIPENLPASMKFFDVAYNNLSGKVPENLNYFPESSFSGNHLKPHHVFASGDHVPKEYQYHHSSKSSIRVAIIAASIGAAVMIAFVILAYYRARFHDFYAQSGFCGHTIGSNIKAGRFSRPPPNLLSFSNDHLLTSNSRSLSGQMDSVQQDNCPTTSERIPSPDSPVGFSPRLSDALEPVTLNVYSPDRLVGELFFLDSSLVFTAEDLSRAPAEVLGRSSHGTLYKATLDNGHLLTVKWLRVGLVKTKKEFAKEVKRIGSVRHQRVVPVRAYYWGPSEQERLVLADFVVGDSLALHLYETTPRRHSPLSFSQRLKVAIDVAEGLVLLHDRGLPHGNLKPTNVLLTSSDYDARVSDYGLHRLMTPAGIAEQILNLGALGYRAPELATSAKPVPSFKADVYAFGVILMELLTRRSAGDIISGQPGAVDLTDWVRQCDQQGRGMDCIDRYIGGGEQHSKGMDDLLAVSLRCILPVNQRPSMRQVYEDIRSISL